MGVTRLRRSGHAARSQGRTRQGDWWLRKRRSAKYQYPCHLCRDGRGGTGQARGLCTDQGTACATLPGREAR